MAYSRTFLELKVHNVPAKLCAKSRRMQGAKEKISDNYSYLPSV